MEDDGSSRAGAIGGFLWVLSKKAARGSGGQVQQSGCHYPIDFTARSLVALADDNLEIAGVNRQLVG
jgi:hypothetical protein